MSTQWDAINIGNYSVAMGYGTYAPAQGSVALGYNTEASGNYSFAAGESNTASGLFSTSFGSASLASGIGSTVFGRLSNSDGDFSFAIGNSADAIGDYSFAGGNNTIAQGASSFAYGYNQQAQGNYSVALGTNNVVSGYAAFAANNDNIATGDNSFAIGDRNLASGIQSFAGGYQSTASNYSSFAFGKSNTVSSAYATAFGCDHTIQLTAQNGFAANSHNIVFGVNATAFGNNSRAHGEASFAAGRASSAIGENSFAQGFESRVNADHSAAIGYRVINNSYGGALVVGHYNDTTSLSYDFSIDNPLFTVGNGTGTSTRSNAFNVSRFGNVTINDAYTLPNSDGTNGYIMQTNGSGTVNWVDPATLSANDADWYVYNTTNTPTSINDNIYTQGNVGIGTATPVYDLHIEAGTGTGMRLNGSGTTSNYTMIVHNTNGRAARFQTGGIVSGWSAANTAIHSIAQGTGAVAGFFVSHNDGASIHTQSQGTGPAIEAEALGSGLAGYFHDGEVLIDDGLESNGGAVFNENSLNYDFRVEGDNQVNVLRVDASNDNVGIGGAPSPLSRLEVTGGDMENGIELSQYKTTIGNSYALKSTSTNTYNGASTAYGLYSQVYKTGDNTTSTIYGLYGYSLDYQTIATGNRYTYGVFGRAFVNSANGTSYARGIYGSFAGNGDNEYAGYFTGDVYTTGTYNTSDDKLKQNISAYNGALQKIEALNPVKYNYKNEQYPLLNLPEGEHIGLIAQEVEKVFPNMVKRADEGPQRIPIEQAKELGIEYRDYDKNDGSVEIGENVEILAINYTNLVPVLVKAIQEQQSQIESFKSIIEDLNARISELER